MAEVVRAHVFVSGSVQGVFFRHETYERATTRKVAGWVRNLPDGRLEAMLEGSKDAVTSMIAWCHQGPRWADVHSVEVEWLEPEGDHTFAVR